MKNGKPHLAYVSELARRQIEAEAAPALFRVISPTAVQAAVRRWQDRHAVTERWTPHDLRRSFASRCGDLGAAPHVIAKLLAHTFTPSASLPVYSSRNGSRSASKLPLISPRTLRRWYWTRQRARRAAHDHQASTCRQTWWTRTWPDSLRRFAPAASTRFLWPSGSVEIEQIAMPEWVVAGYFKGMNRWWLYRCKTLDEAFGVQWPKGKSFEAASRRRYYLEDTILREVKEAARKGESLTPELFAKIGKQHGIGKTLAWDYYTGARQKLQDLKLPGVELLLEPYMTRAARVKRATRKISKLSGEWFQAQRRAEYI